MKDFGSYLKELRGRRSLREVSKAMDISHSYLDTLEKGYDPRTKKVRKPSYDVLKKLSSFYGVSYLELLYKAGYADEKTYELNKDLDDPALIADDRRAIDLNGYLNPRSGIGIIGNNRLLSSKERENIIKFINLKPNEQEEVMKFIDTFIIKKGDN